MMPSSTGCEQSTVNFSVCLRFTSFFAFLIACARKGPRDLRRERRWAGGRADALTICYVLSGTSLALQVSRAIGRQIRGTRVMSVETELKRGRRNYDLEPLK